MKTAIVVDSTAYLPPGLKLDCPIEFIPIKVMFEGKVYRDGVDLTTEQAYQFLEKNPNDWATSAPSPGDFLSAYKKLANQGIEEIICLAIPQSISATQDSARMAKQMAKEQLPNIKIEVVDTGTAVVGETLLVLKVSQAIKEGKSFEEIIKMIEDLKSKLRVYLLLETIRYIYRSGRIPEVASKIGAILPLKPILTIHGGKLSFAGTTTSQEKSRKKILGTLKENFDPNNPEIGIMHIDSLKEADDFSNQAFNVSSPTTPFISEFSPIIGYAVGKGTLGIGFFAK